MAIPGAFRAFAIRLICSKTRLRGFHHPLFFLYPSQTNPDIHLYAARLIMGVDTSGARQEDAGELPAGAIVDLMRELGMPNGLGAVGFGPEDLDQLVAGVWHSNGLPNYHRGRPTKTISRNSFWTRSSAGRIDMNRFMGLWFFDSIA